MKMNKEFVADVDFLKSVSKNAQYARACGGLNTPEPSLKFVELQLLNEISSKLSAIAEMLSVKKEEKVVDDAKIESPAKAETKETAIKATVTAKTTAPAK